MLDSSKGDVYIDYRKGDDAVVSGIQDALKGQKLRHAYDAVSEKSSYKNLGRVLDPNGGKITLVLPAPGALDWSAPFPDIPEGVLQSRTNVGSVHGNIKDFGYVYFRYFTRGLEEGWFRGQTQEVMPGGLHGVETALKKLKDGSASAVKYVFKISETEGAGSDV